MASSETINCKIKLSNEVKLCDREVQTSVPDSVSIGIQCKLDQEDLCTNNNVPIIVSSSSTDDINLEKNKYFTFVKEKSTIFSNGKLECLLCGEIVPSIKRMYKHMTQHWGPAQLCSECGVYFKTEGMFKYHSCPKKISDSAKKRLLYCPHYKCPVQAISKLELYDHINEHCSNPTYDCKGCCRSFLTYQDLKWHSILRFNCLEKYQKLPMPDFLLKSDTFERKRVCLLNSITGKRFVSKKHLTQFLNSNYKRNSQTCKICLKNFNSIESLKNHRRRCIIKFQKRLVKIKKKISPSEPN